VPSVLLSKFLDATMQPVVVPTESDENAFLFFSHSDVMFDFEASLITARDFSNVNPNQKRRTSVTVQ
jgi:hypothetical protein